MRSLAVILAVLVSVLVGGCGLLPPVIDETAHWSAQKLYSEAMGRMSDTNYQGAITYFQKLESRFPYGRYAAQAQLETAYAYYLQDEPIPAVSACDRFIRDHPNNPHVDYAYYLKGLANFSGNLGLFDFLSHKNMAQLDPKSARDAFDTFKELVTKFPHSKYTADATARMKYLVDVLAAHEVEVAAYYLKRGAYVAAVDRAQGAIKTYPGAPSEEQALVITIKAYNALGMDKLRDDSLRILRKNFPKSAYLGYVKPEKKPWWKFW